MSERPPPRQPELWQQQVSLNSLRFCQDVQKLWHDSINQSTKALPPTDDPAQKTDMRRRLLDVYIDSFLGIFVHTCATTSSPNEGMEKAIQEQIHAKFEHLRENWDSIVAALTPGKKTLGPTGSKLAAVPPTKTEDVVQ